MTKREYCIKRLIFAVLLLTLFDAVFSVIGIRMGMIGEANPILHGLMQQHPEPVALAAFLYTLFLMAVVSRLGPRCRCTVPLMYGLCTIKAVVIGLHVGWLLAV